jgi:hypothetical protein
MKYEITTSLFSRREQHFRSVSNIVSIPEDIGRQCDWRTCRSRRGILDVWRKFHRKKFKATLGFLSLSTPPRDHSIDFGDVSLNIVKMDLTLY